MQPSPVQASSSAPGAHLVLYDGVCGLCNRLLQFLLRHDDRAVFSFSSLQSTTGRATVARWGGDPDDLASFYVIAGFRTPGARVVTKSEAALFVARELGWPWNMALGLRVFPLALRNRAYDVIARSRYRVFGRYDQCPIPTEDARSRFVE